MAGAKRRRLSILTKRLSFLALIPLFSCQASSQEDAEVPARRRPSVDHRPVFGSWSAPRNLDVEYFQFLVDLGFTHTLYWRSPRLKPEQWRKDLDRAAELGVRLVFDSWQPAAIPEDWLDAVLETGCTHPAFAGVYAPDEPGYRFPLEGPTRQPSVERFQSAYNRLKECGSEGIFHVDAASAETRWVRQFLPFASVFGLDIYPYKEGVDWKRYVERATSKATRLAGNRPVWMVLQGHGRRDWYEYATENLRQKIPLEADPRPTKEVLLEMAWTALTGGAEGVWWWSFELYDWQDSEHRRFILQFTDIHKEIRRRLTADGLGAR